MGKREEKEEEFRCRLGRIVVEVNGKTVEIPAAVCMLGEKIEVRVPDKRLLQDLFKKEK